MKVIAWAVPAVLARCRLCQVLFDSPHGGKKGRPRDGSEVLDLSSSPRRH
jgi:hypothetical protein